MLIYAARRLATLLLTLFVVSILTFLVPYLGRQDPVRAIIRTRLSNPAAADEETMAAVRASMGLDQPLPVQYLRWLANTVQGDFGFSYASREPVGGLVLNALVVTIVLTSVALVVALLLAVPLGILAASRTGGLVDRAITFFSQAFVAVPEFALAPVLILIFSLSLGVLPSAGWGGASFIVLPAVVLALRPLGVFTQVARASMVNVMSAPYVTAAAARGLNRLQTIRRHVLRNGLVPVVTLFGVWLAALFGGSVVIEVIFAIPGMGRLIYDAVVNSDLPVFQAGILCVVALAVVINTATDLILAVMNPAIRVGGRHG